MTAKEVRQLQEKYPGRFQAVLRNGTWTVSKKTNKSKVVEAPKA